MYIHLGQDTVVKTEDVIGIFDLDTATISKSTRDYLARAERNGEVINITEELPKTFVVVKKRKQKGKKIYISQISTSTLLKRADYISNLGHG